MANLETYFRVFFALNSLLFQTFFFAAVGGVGAGDKRKGDQLTLAPTLFLLLLLFFAQLSLAHVCVKEKSKKTFFLFLRGGNNHLSTRKKSSPCVFNLNLAESEKKIISCAGKRGSRDSAKKGKKESKSFAVASSSSNEASCLQSRKKMRRKGEKYKKDSSSSSFSPASERGGKRKKSPGGK